MRGSWGKSVGKLFKLSLHFLCLKLFQNKRFFLKVYLSVSFGSVEISFDFHVCKLIYLDRRQIIPLLLWKLGN